MMKLLLAALALCGAALPTQDKPEKRELANRVEIPGKVVCIGCTLEKEAGAEAQCTLHAQHAQGLVDPDGMLWTFVDNAKGHLVIANAKLRDKEIKVLGWKYPKSQYIEVSKYQVKEGALWVAYDFCKACGFEPGDHQDKDLCADCSEESP